MDKIKRKALILSVLVALGYGVYQYFRPYNPLAQTLTPAQQVSTPVQKDSPVVKTLFAQIKPQCIGRYVIDVPESFNNKLHDMIFIDGFKIESKPLYPPAFKQRVQLREQALRDAGNKPGNRPENAPFLKEVILLPDGKGAIFDHNESGTPDIYRQLEAHVYSGMIAFVVTTDIRDFSDKKHSEKNRNI